jgi:hypothetical protein
MKFWSFFSIVMIFVAFISLCIFCVKFPVIPLFKNLKFLPPSSEVINPTEKPIIIKPIYVSSKNSKYLITSPLKLPPNSPTTYYSPITITLTASPITFDLSEFYIPTQSNITLVGGDSSSADCGIALPVMYGTGFIYTISNSSSIPVVISVFANMTPSPTLQTSPCPETPTPSSGLGTLHYVNQCTQCDSNVNFCTQADNNVLPEDTKSNYIMGSNLSDWGCSNITANMKAVYFENETEVYILEPPLSSEGFSNNCSFLQSGSTYVQLPELSTISSTDSQTIEQCSNACSLNPNCTGYLLQNFSNGTGTCLLQANPPPANTSIYCESNATGPMLGTFKQPQMVNPGNNCSSSQNIYIHTDDKTLIDTIYNISESECSQRCQLDSGCEMYLMGNQGNSTSCELFSDVSNVQTFCSAGQCPVPHEKYGKVKAQSIAPTTMELPRNACTPSTIVTYGYLNVNDFIYSPSQNYKLTLQSDHNIVIYNMTNGAVQWASGTNQSTVENPTLTLLGDGNFALIPNYNPAVYTNYTSFPWSSNTSNSAADMVILTNSGTLMVINYYNKIKYFESQAGSTSGEGTSNIYGGLGSVPESLIPHKVFIDSSNFTPYRTLTTDYSSCMDICATDGNCKMALASDSNVNNCMLYDDFVPSTTTALSTSNCNSTTYNTYGMVKSSANPSGSTMIPPYNTNNATNGQFINATSTPIENATYYNVSIETCNSLCNNNLDCQMALTADGQTCTLYKDVSGVTAYDTSQENAQYFGNIKSTNSIPCAANNGSSNACCNQSGTVATQYQCPSNKPTCVGYVANQTFGTCQQQTVESFTSESPTVQPTPVSESPTVQPTPVSESVYTNPPIKSIAGSIITPGTSLTLANNSTVSLLSIYGGYALLDSSGETSTSSLPFVNSLSSPQFSLESNAFESPVNIVLNAGNTSVRFDFSNYNLPTNSTIFIQQSFLNNNFANVLNLPPMLNSSTLYIYNQNSKNILNVVYSNGFSYQQKNYQSFVMEANSFVILNYTLGYINVAYELNVNFNYQSVTNSDTCTSLLGTNFNYCPELGIYYCCGVCNGTTTPCPSDSSLVSCGCIPFNNYTTITTPPDVEKFTTDSYQLPTINTFTGQPPATYDYSKVGFSNQSVFILDKDTTRYTQTGTLHYISTCDECNDENTYLPSNNNWCSRAINRTPYLDFYTLGSTLSVWGCEKVTEQTLIVYFNVPTLNAPDGEIVTGGVFAVEPSQEVVSNNNIVNFILPSYGAVNNGTYYTVCNPNPIVYLVIKCPQYIQNDNFNGLTNSSQICLNPNYVCSFILLNQSWFLVSYADELGNSMQTIPLSPPVYDDIIFISSPTPIPTYQEGPPRVTQLVFTTETEDYGYIIWTQNPCFYFDEQSYNFTFLNMQIQAIEYGYNFIYDYGASSSSSESLTNINKYIQNTENLQNNTVTLTLSDGCPPSGSMPTGNSSWSFFTSQLSIVYYNIISNYETYGSGQWQSLIKYIAESFLALTPNYILNYYQGSSSEYQDIQKVFPNGGRNNTILENLTPSTQNQLWNSYTNNDSFSISNISNNNFSTFSSMMQGFASLGNYCQTLANIILYQMLQYTTSLQPNIDDALDKIGGSSPGSQPIGFSGTVNPNPGFYMSLAQSQTININGGYTLVLTAPSSSTGVGEWQVTFNNGSPVSFTPQVLGENVEQFSTQVSLIYTNDSDFYFYAILYQVYNEVYYLIYNVSSSERSSTDETFTNPSLSIGDYGPVTCSSTTSEYTHVILAANNLNNSDDYSQSQISQGTGGYTVISMYLDQGTGAATIYNRGNVKLSNFTTPNKSSDTDFYESLQLTSNDYTTLFFLFRTYNKQIIYYFNDMSYNSSSCNLFAQNSCNDLLGNDCGSSSSSTSWSSYCRQNRSACDY